MTGSSESTLSTPPLAINEVDAVQWQSWVPRERAVLCFIRDTHQIMLIHKKTGLGTGKVNAPGGRIEPGEAAVDATIRECQEEIGLTPLNPYKVGELFFIFTDGYSLHGTVFFSDSFTGTPIQTIEADPFWCPLDAIPYDEMWEDDIYWLPLALSGRCFKAYFIFDGDRMLSRRVEEVQGF